MKKHESIYENAIGYNGEIEITLTGDERSIISNALSKCAPYEVNIIPLIKIMQKLSDDGRNERNETK